MAQVIKRTSVNPWGQAFGAIGQGVSGFTNGMMAKNQLDMQQKMIEMFGKNGGGIMPPGAGTAQNPVTQPTASAQPVQNQPTAQGGATDLSSPMTMEQLMAMIYKQPNTYGV